MKTNINQEKQISHIDSEPIKILLRFALEINQNAPQEQAEKFLNHVFSFPSIFVSEKDIDDYIKHYPYIKKLNQKQLCVEIICQKLLILIEEEPKIFIKANTKYIIKCLRVGKILEYNAEDFMEPQQMKSDMESEQIEDFIEPEQMESDMEPQQVERGKKQMERGKMQMESMNSYNDKDGEIMQRPQDFKDSKSSNQKTPNKNKSLPGGLRSSKNASNTSRRDLDKNTSRRDLDKINRILKIEVEKENKIKKNAKISNDLAAKDDDPRDEILGKRHALFNEDYNDVVDEAPYKNQISQIESTVAKTIKKKVTFVENSSKNQSKVDERQNSGHVKAKKVTADDDSDESLYTEGSGNVEPGIGKSFDNVEPDIGKSFDNVEPDIGKSFDNVEPGIGKSFDNVEPDIRKSGNRKKAAATMVDERQNSGHVKAKKVTADSDERQNSGHVKAKKVTADSDESLYTEGSGNVEPGIGKSGNRKKAPTTMIDKKTINHYSKDNGDQYEQGDQGDSLYIEKSDNVEPDIGKYGNRKSGNIKKAAATMIDKKTINHHSKNNGDQGDQYEHGEQGEQGEQDDSLYIERNYVRMFKICMSHFFQLNETHFQFNIDLFLGSKYKAQTYVKKHILDFMMFIIENGLKIDREKILNNKDIKQSINELIKNLKKAKVSTEKEEKSELNDICVKEFKNLFVILRTQVSEEQIERLKKSLSKKEECGGLAIKHLYKIAEHNGKNQTEIFLVKKMSESENKYKNLSSVNLTDLLSYRPIKPDSKDDILTISGRSLIIFKMTIAYFFKLHQKDEINKIWIINAIKSSRLEENISNKTVKNHFFNSISFIIKNGLKITEDIIENLLESNKSFKALFSRLVDLLNTVKDKKSRDEYQEEIFEYIEQIFDVIRLKVTKIVGQDSINKLQKSLQNKKCANLKIMVESIKDSTVMLLINIDYESNLNISNDAEEIGLEEIFLNRRGRKNKLRVKKNAAEKHISEDHISVDEHDTENDVENEFDVNENAQNKDEAYVDENDIKNDFDENDVNNEDAQNKDEAYVNENDVENEFDVNENAQNKDVDNEILNNSGNHNYYSKNIQNDSGNHNYYNESRQYEDINNYDLNESENENENENEFCNNGEVYVKVHDEPRVAVPLLDENPENPQANIVTFIKTSHKDEKIYVEDIKAIDKDEKIYVEDIKAIDNEIDNKKSKISKNKVSKNDDEIYLGYEISEYQSSKNDFEAENNEQNKKSDDNEIDNKKSKISKNNDAEVLGKRHVLFDEDYNDVVDEAPYKNQISQIRSAKQTIKKKVAFAENSSKNQSMVNKKKNNSRVKDKKVTADSDDSLYIEGSDNVEPEIRKSFDNVEPEIRKSGNRKKAAATMVDKKTINHYSKDNGAQGEQGEQGDSLYIEGSDNVEPGIGKSFGNVEPGIEKSGNRKKAAATMVDKKTINHYLKDNGEQGEQGEQGKQGEQYEQGEQGDQGDSLYIERDYVRMFKVCMSHFFQVNETDFQFNIDSFLDKIVKVETYVMNHIINPMMFIIENGLKIDTQEMLDNKDITRGINKLIKNLEKAKISTEKEEKSELSDICVKEFENLFELLRAKVDEGKVKRLKDDLRKEACEGLVIKHGYNSRKQTKILLVKKMPQTSEVENKYRNFSAINLTDLLSYCPIKPEPKDNTLDNILKMTHNSLVIFKMTIDYFFKLKKLDKINKKQVITVIKRSGFKIKILASTIEKHLFKSISFIIKNGLEITEDIIGDLLDNNKSFKVLFSRLVDLLNTVRDEKSRDDNQEEIFEYIEKIFDVIRLKVGQDSIDKLAKDLQNKECANLKIITQPSGSYISILFIIRDDESNLNISNDAEEIALEEIFLNRRGGKNKLRVKKNAAENHMSVEENDIKNDFDENDVENEFDVNEDDDESPNKASFKQVGISKTKFNASVEGLKTLKPESKIKQNKAIVKKILNKKTSFDEKNNSKNLVIYENENEKYLFIDRNYISVFKLSLRLFFEPNSSFDINTIFAFSNKTISKKTFYSHLIKPICFIIKNETGIDMKEIVKSIFDKDNRVEKLLTLIKGYKNANDKKEYKRENEGAVSDLLNNIFDDLRNEIIEKTDNKNIVQTLKQSLNNTTNKTTEIVSFQQIISGGVKCLNLLLVSKDKISVYKEERKELLERNNLERNNKVITLKDLIPIPHEEEYLSITNHYIPIFKLSLRLFFEPNSSFDINTIFAFSNKTISKKTFYSHLIKPICFIIKNETGIDMKEIVKSIFDKDNRVEKLLTLIKGYKNANDKKEYKRENEGAVSDLLNNIFDDLRNEIIEKTDNKNIVQTLKQSLNNTTNKTTEIVSFQQIISGGVKCLNLLLVSKDKISVYKEECIEQLKHKNKVITLKDLFSYKINFNNKKDIPGYKSDLNNKKDILGFKINLNNKKEVLVDFESDFNNEKEVPLYSESESSSESSSESGNTLCYKKFSTTKYLNDYRIKKKDISNNKGKKKDIANGEEMMEEKVSHEVNPEKELKIDCANNALVQNYDDYSMAQEDIGNNKGMMEEKIESESESFERKRTADDWANGPDPIQKTTDDWANGPDPIHSNILDFSGKINEDGDFGHFRESSSEY